MSKPRLKTIRPRLQVQPPRLQTVSAGSWRGSKTKTAARGYDADWKRLRAAHIAANPHCVFCLRKLGMLGMSPAEVILECARRRIVQPFGNIGDHITPHRGDDRLRLDPANIQTLCKPCHDGEKSAQERAAGYR